MHTRKWDFVTSFEIIIIIIIIITIIDLGAIYIVSMPLQYLKERLKNLEKRKEKCTIKILIVENCKL